MNPHSASIIASLRAFGRATEGPDAKAEPVRAPGPSSWVEDVRLEPGGLAAAARLLAPALERVETTNCGVAAARSTLRHQDTSVATSSSVGTGKAQVRIPRNGAAPGSRRVAAHPEPRRRARFALRSRQRSRACRHAAPLDRGAAVWFWRTRLRPSGGRTSTATCKEKQGLRRREHVVSILADQRRKPTTRITSSRGTRPNSDSPCFRRGDRSSHPR